MGCLLLVVEKILFLDNIICSGEKRLSNFLPNIYNFFLGQLVREDYSELRQEASDLQEYSNAKLDRVTRYLGVLADRTRKLGK